MRRLQQCRSRDQKSYSKQKGIGSIFEGKIKPDTFSGLKGAGSLVTRWSRPTGPCSHAADASMPAAPRGIPCPVPSCRSCSRISRSIASIASRVVFSHSARFCDIGSGDVGSTVDRTSAGSSKGLTKSRTSSPTAGSSLVLRALGDSLPLSAPAAASAHGVCWKATVPSASKHR